MLNGCQPTNESHALNLVTYRMHARVRVGGVCVGLVRGPVNQMAKVELSTHNGKY